jgi:hypothetical protein
MNEGMWWRFPVAVLLVLLLACFYWGTYYALLWYLIPPIGWH